jgi:hypothetical protein
MENSLTGLDEAIPVLKYQILPTFGTSTIAPDIVMKEMSISYQPGLIIKEDFGGGGEHGSTVDSKSVKYLLHRG